MTMMMLNRPHTGEPLLPPVSRPVQKRMEAWLKAFDPLIDTAARRNPLLAGCAVAPFAGFVLMGTSCRRPLLLPEGRILADATGHNVVLLRHDAERGTSFDLWLQDREDWLCGYAAWRRRGCDLWLLPTVGDGPYVRVTPAGLERETQPPFLDAEEHRRGIIRAVDFPSFEGSL